MSDDETFWFGTPEFLAPGSLKYLYVSFPLRFLLFFALFKVPVPNKWVDIAMAIIFAMFYISIGVAVYLDSEFLNGKTNWRPSHWYLLSTVPLIGTAFHIVYLVKRWLALVWTN